MQTKHMRHMSIQFIVRLHTCFIYPAILQIRTTFLNAIVGSHSQNYLLFLFCLPLVAGVRFHCDVIRASISTIFWLLSFLFTDCSSFQKKKEEKNTCVQMAISINFHLTTTDTHRSETPSSPGIFSNPSQTHASMETQYSINSHENILLIFYLTFETATKLWHIKSTHWTQI